MRLMGLAAKVGAWLLTIVVLVAAGTAPTSARSIGPPSEWVLRERFEIEIELVRSFHVFRMTRCCAGKQADVNAAFLHFLERRQRSRRLSGDVRETIEEDSLSADVAHARCFGRRIEEEFDAR
mgnify:CR=1 FL=1